MFGGGHDGEVKLVVTKNFELGNADEKKIVSTFELFGQSKRWGRDQNDFFLIEQYCTSFKLSGDTLPEETTPVVIENFEIENRHNSMEKFFDFWESPEFDAKSKRLKFGSNRFLYLEGWWLWSLWSKRNL